MRLDDFVYVLGSYAAVPGRLRVNDHRDTLGALVQAARLVGPDDPLEPPFVELLLERGRDGVAVFRGAAAAGLTFDALVDAYEDVMTKLSQGIERLSAKSRTC